MGKLILVTGGVRSGKSAFAERYCLRAAKNCAYIATAEITDEEMAERVRLHRARRRNGRWSNFEAPYEAEKIFQELPHEVGAVLFDCITVYLANAMYGRTTKEDTIARGLAAVKKLAAAALEWDGLTVFVSDEVGCGVVPPTPVGREYRDASGWANQHLAALAAEVYQCTAGLAVEIKGGAHPLSPAKTVKE